MATLDPSIFLQTRPKSAFEYLQEMAAADDAKQTRQLRGLQLLAQQGQMQDAQQARDIRNRGMAAVQGLGGSATDDQRISALRGAGDYTTADSLEKSMLERQKTGSEVAKNKAAQQADEWNRQAQQIDLVLQAVSSAKDQPSYTRAVQFLASQGVDVANVPPQFDPDAVAQFGQMALTAKDRLAQQLKQQEFEQNARNDLVGPDGKLNYSLVDAKKQVANAGKTTVSVNTGQKGFDNTLKLRGDFRSEPVYKAHQEMQSAYSQIKQALKQASPAGDLAGATKIMKLLDPGSVVRESELGMAMAASGLMDRVTNYAQNILNGTKLTPNQRADFQKLADALYTESVSQYNNKRGEYEGIAKRNELNVQDVLGEASAAPAGKVIDFGSLK